MQKNTKYKLMTKYIEENSYKLSSSYVKVMITLTTQCQTITGVLV